MSAIGTINERKVSLRMTTGERGRGVKRREVKFDKSIERSEPIYSLVVGGSISLVNFLCK